MWIRLAGTSDGTSGRRRVHSAHRLLDQPGLPEAGLPISETARPLAGLDRLDRRDESLHLAFAADQRRAAEAAGPPPAGPPPQDPEGRDRLGLALDVDPAARLEVERAVDEPVGLLR